jgi:hypothetical protein
VLALFVQGLHVENSHLPCSSKTTCQPAYLRWRKDGLSFLTASRSCSKGGVCIKTTNPDALKAIHEFLRFQIEENTGDTNDIGPAEPQTL